MLALIPNPWAAAWATTYRIPPIFTDAAYRSCLTPTDVVLPQPIGVGGDAMLWQVANDFRFRMAGGRIQQIPPSPFMHPDSIALVSGGYELKPQQAQLVRNYIREKGVTVALVDKTRSRPWTSVLDRIAKRQDVGGVYLYRFSGGAPGCPAR